MHMTDSREEERQQHNSSIMVVSIAREAVLSVCYFDRMAPGGGMPDRLECLLAKNNAADSYRGRLGVDAWKMVQAIK